MSRSLCLLFTSMLLLACGRDASDTSTTSETPNDAPVWYPEVQTLVVQHCGACHTAGGDAPFPLDSYEFASATAAAMRTAIADGTMPPWHADPACQHFEGERILAEEDKSTLLAWIDAGAPAGDPNDAADVERPQPPSFTPSFTGAVDGYPVSDASLDDWRCFPFPEIEFTEETWLVGSAVVPGSPAVHHVLVSIVEPGQVADVMAADAAEPGLGYPCIGGVVPGQEPGTGVSLPKVGFPNMIATWVPGIAPEVLTDGTARRVAPGSLVVAQVHYNMLYTGPTEDHTQVQLLRSDTPPTRLRHTGQILYYDLDIPAGERDVSFTGAVPYHSRDPLELVGFIGHMHMLGSSLRSRVVPVEPAEQPAEMCLVDIPRWDFHWQQRYTRPTEEALVVASGSSLEVTCTYDNSAANQPEVDGVQQQPRDVGWGESSLDEMCLIFVERLEDYQPLQAADAPACAASEACLAACAGSPAECLFDCEETDYECVACVIAATQGCAIDCVAPLASALECLQGCVLGTMMFDGNFGACLAAECGDVYTPFAACLDGHLADSTCNAAFAGCGAGF